MAERVTSLGVTTQSDQAAARSEPCRQLEHEAQVDETRLRQGPPITVGRTAEPEARVDRLGSGHDGQGVEDDAVAPVGAAGGP